MLTRKRTLWLKVEAAKGVKETAALTPCLVSEPTMDPSAPFEARFGGGNSLGHELPGTLGEVTGTCKFKMEVASTGAAAACGAGLLAALQGCGLDATNLSPVSDPDDQKTLTLELYKDGHKETLHGAMGTVNFTGETGKTLFAEFEFSGIWTTTADVAMPSFAPVQGSPMKMRGGTFTLGAETRKISKYSLTPGGVLAPQYDVNADSGISNFIITDFDPTISFDPEAVLVATYDDRGIWLAGTESEVVLEVSDGTYTATITTPKVQPKELPEGDREGLYIYEFSGQCNNDEGDDAMAIAFAAA